MPYWRKMNIVAAILGMVFLCAAVQPDDPDDETNINICLNINVGPGCAGGHCRPPPNNNCNKNATSGQMVGPTPGNLDLKSTLTRPYEHSDWENKTIDACKEESCRTYCINEQQYTYGICVAANVCHCYGHKPVQNETRSQGWWDHQRPSCEEEACSTHCHYNGFSYSFCVNNNTCHCYEIVDPPSSKPLEPTGPQQTTVTSIGHNFPEWEDNPHPSCKNDDCQHYCQQKSYVRAVCWLNESTCHCYSYVHNSTHGVGWEDSYDPQCEADACHHHCYYNGFTFSICVDNKTCHCYTVVSPETMEPTKSLQIITTGGALQTEVSGPHHQWENISQRICENVTCFKLCQDKGYTNDVCLLDGRWCHCYSHITNTTHGTGWEDEPDANCDNNRCSLHCNQNGFDNSICVNNKTCHCYKVVYPESKETVEPSDSKHTVHRNALRVPEWENITVGVCKDDICLQFCGEKGYANHACLLDGLWCHCYGHITNSTHGTGWEDDTEANCDNNRCSHHCSQNGFDHSICVNNNTCHCYKVVYPETNGKLEPTTHAIATRGPRVSEWENITLSVCTDDICIQVCKDKGYVYHTCLLNGRWCHCYGHARDTSHGQRWEDYQQPECDEEICSYHGNENGFDYSICVNNKTCHCYKIGPTPQTVQPKEPPDWYNLPLPLCYDAVCLYICEKKQFTHGVCLDEDMCHCYGHEVNGTHGSDWEDDPLLTCDKDGCVRLCNNHGFIQSVCPDNKTCHCYEEGVSQISRSITQQTLNPNRVPDWENLTIPLCYNDVCINYCEMKQYTNGVCLDQQMCHCYGHKNRIGTQDLDWEDASYSDCDTESCSNHCSVQGFFYSVCLDCCKCHCYRARPRSKLRAFKIEPWNDYTIANCINCLQLCKVMGHSNGICKDSRTCHCFSCDPKTPQSGCKDEHLGECKSKSCSSTCLTSGFVKSLCMDQNTCHCYDSQLSATTALVPAETAKLNVAAGLCYQASCSYHCRTKGFSVATCSGSTSCLCSSRANGKNIIVELCNRYSCSYFCSMMDYVYGTCTNNTNCYCSGKPTGKSTKRRSIKTFKQKICFDVICEVLCQKLGSSEGVCIDEKTCKCGRAVQKVRNRPESINNPLEAQTLPTNTRDPLLNKERDFVEEVCILALCKNKCRRHNFRKGFCVEGGSRHKCHCYEARRL